MRHGVLMWHKYAKLASKGITESHMPLSQGRFSEQEVGKYNWNLFPDDLIA